ncbi:MAG: 4-hydroxy-tetrahydrodipicolinate synthase [Planctomycetes bacterium]|nr:4-hydroxy-tetrahydrodipicolinate synthase [Planctomycetota bacterium]
MQGAITAIITPFAADLSVDFAALDRVIDRQLQQGIDGLVVCGSTGEAITLTQPEREQVIAHAVNRVGKRKPVFAGTSASSTAETVAGTLKARDLGADGALIAAPAYNRPQQEGLYLHFAAVARAVGDFPVMLYNIPGRTAVHISTETIARLVRDFPRVFTSYKDATNNLKQADEILAQCPGMAFFSGDDAATLPLGALGAVGIVSVVSNLVPAEMATLARQINAGEFAAARALHRKLVPLIDACFTESNPVPVKAGCAMLGLCGETARPPLAPISSMNRQAMRQALAPFKAE